MTTRLLIAVLAVNLANATLMVEQQEGGPSGSVGWSESAALCRLLPNSAASSFNFETGAVTFNGASYGTIGLACTVPGIANALSPFVINAYAFSFLDPSGEPGPTTPECSVAAYLVDRTAPAVLEGWSSEKSFSGSRFWTVDVHLNNSNNNLVNGHFYDVDIYLFRPKSAVGKCSPTAYGAYLEDLCTIF